MESSEGSDFVSLHLVFRRCRARTVKITEDGPEGSIYDVAVDSALRKHRRQILTT